MTQPPVAGMALETTEPCDRRVSFRGAYCDGKSPRLTREWLQRFSEVHSGFSCAPPSDLLDSPVNQTPSRQRSPLVDFRQRIDSRAADPLVSVLPGLLQLPTRLLR